MSNTRRPKQAPPAEVDIAAELAAATPQRRTVPICLRGDLAEEFERLDDELRELNRAERAAAASLASGGQARALAERIESLRQEMLAVSVPFTLQAIDRKRWQKVLDEHPAREDDDGDRLAGFNRDTFLPALIRTSLVAPVFSDEQWAQLIDEILSPGQYETLSNAAWSLNRRGADIPFSSAALRTLGRSATE